MRQIVIAGAAALLVAGCQTYPNDPYNSPYGTPYPTPYPAPYPAPYPNPYPAPYPQYPQYPQGPAPMPMPASLTGTNWRVLAINGQQVPQTNFYMNFMPDRLSAKLGCNSLGGGYTATGQTLSVGALVATRMACPDMHFETQGSAILSRPMTINWMNPERMTLSNSLGTIELVKAG